MTKTNKAIENVAHKNERHKFKFIEWSGKLAIYQCSECQEKVNSKTLYKTLYEEKCKPGIIRYEKK